MTMAFRRILAAALGACLAMGGAAAVSAQTAEQRGQPPAISNPSDEQLRSFAAASLEVDRLNNRWATRIEDATAVEEKQQLRSQALQEMSTAVQDEGLSVSEYNALVGTVEADPAVAETVAGYRNEMSQ